MGEGQETLPEVMMKLQIGSGRGSLVHRANDIRAAGNTMGEAELGVSWRAGAYRPEDSWLPPLLWLCVYHFTATLTWLTRMPLHAPAPARGLGPIFTIYGICS